MPSVISNNRPKHSWRFSAIGTAWSIDTTQSIDHLKKAVEDRIESFDLAYSRFRDDSLVSQITRRAGVYDFPPDDQELLQFYRELYDMTDGAVSPLVGKILNDAGYDSDYSLDPKGVAPAASWDESMTLHGSTLRTNRPLLLDFGAAGKGCLVDIIADLLQQNGVSEFIIDASGDMRVKGFEEKVGLENPFDTSEVIGVATIRNASLCASATNRRKWKQWHHIIDPRTARPVSDIVATWVIASDTMHADGFATALFFVDGAAIDRDIAYVRLLADGTVERSSNFVGELFI